MAKKPLTEEQKEKARIYQKEYYNKNKTTIINKSKEYYNDNKDSVLKRNSTYSKENRETINTTKRKYNKKNYQKNRDVLVERNKQWFKKNPEYRKKYEADKRKNDVCFKLKQNISKSIRQSLKKNNHNKKSRTHSILGCSFIEFKKYLESKFESWMNWENYGQYNGSLNHGWDIDHIVPLSSVNTEEDIIKLNHYTNLQPLCSYTNRYVKKAIIADVLE